MKKGIIMEINERFLTMLTPEGEFLQAKKQEHYYEIGQEIYFSPIQEAEKEKLWSFSIFSGLKGKSFAAMAMAVALIIAIVSFIPFHNQNQVYAYMSIDVNPSIEIGINDQLKVIELTAYNESGKQVIETIEDWENKSLNDVTGQLLTAIKEQGYLAAQKDVVIGTVHTGKIIETSEEKLDRSIKKLEENIKQDEVKIISVEATTEDRELAKESGVTVGQFVKEKTEKIKNQTEKKQLPSNNKKPEKVEPKNSNGIKNPPARNIAPGQQKKAENQNKSQDVKQNSNKIPPGKNKEGKDNNKNKSNEKDRNNGKNKNNGEKNRNNGNNSKQDHNMNDQSNKNKNRDKNNSSHNREGNKENNKE